MDTELDSIQGTWDIVQLEVNGTQMDAEAFAGSRIIVDGDAFVTEAMGAAYSGTVRLDSATRPKAIDLHFTAGVEQGNLNRGIYERNGDEWTICLNTTGGGRPTAFATSADSGFALETLRRANPGAKRDSAAPSLSFQDRRSETQTAPDTVGLNDDALALQGEWTAISIVTNGEPLPAQFARMAKRTMRA